MKKPKAHRILQVVVLITSIILVAWAAPEILQRLGWEWGEGDSNDDPAEYIVQGLDLQAVSTLVNLQGGEIIHSLPLINAVVARLTTGQVKALLNSRTVTQIFENRSEETLVLASNHPVPPDPSPPANQH